MKYLHLMPPSERMMQGFIDMFNTHGRGDQHEFLMYSDCPKSQVSILLEDNVTSFESLGRKNRHRYKAVKEKMEKADIVLWHSFMPRRDLLIFAYRNRKLLNKTIWISWGIDLYNWRRSDNSLKSIVVNYLNKKCRESMLAVNIVFQTDEKVALSQFGDEYKVFFSPYCIRQPIWDKMNALLREDSEKSYNFCEDFNVIKQVKERSLSEVYDINFCISDSCALKIAKDIGITSQNPKDTDKNVLEQYGYTAPVRIQIGNNAFKFNNHKEAMDSLKHFKYEDIEIIVPISYGGDNHTTPKWYKRAIQDYGKNYFDSKIEYIQRIMSQMRYTSYLHTVDIGIFYSERQNGLGNILKFIYFGKKIYMNPNNPLFKYFNDLGVKIFSTELIKGQTFEEFIDKSEMNTNGPEWIKEYYLPENSVVLWEDMLTNAYDVYAAKRRKL